MRNRFDQQLEFLNTELIEMGTMIEVAINNSVKALIERDVELAHHTAHNDGQINEKESKIEARALRLLLQQQPVAADLRVISVALKMITDMERIGDQARDIAYITIDLAKKDYHYKLVHIPDMATRAALMVRHAIDAFTHRDLEMAYEVIRADDEVDRLFYVVKKEMVEWIRRNDEYSENAIDLMMIAKYLERIGDHATNIAEWVIFSLTGRHKSDVMVEARSESGTKLEKK